MIAFLTKSDTSEGFNQIIDFLNASSIKYALTVNPNIYVSVIKQFWNSVAVKKVNDVSRLQALVDRKKVIITKATIRDALRLDDAEGIECLPNEEIFIELARIGSSMTSAVICLSTGAAKVNIEDVSTAGVAAEGVASAADDEVPVAVDEPSIPSIPSPPPHTQPPTITRYTFHFPKITKLKQRVKKLERRNKASKLRRLKRVGIAQRVETSDDNVMDDVSKQGRIIADIDADKDVTLKDVAVVAKDVQDAEIEESLDVQGRQAESQAQIYQIDL
nr:xylulose kinase-1 [Tanacetum cinerariifolium]